MIFDALRRWMGGDPSGNGSGNGSGKGHGNGHGNGKGDGDAPEGAADQAEMLTCEAALSRLYEFLDGELEGVSAEQVEAHLRVCARCYPNLVMERSFRAALRRAAAGETAPPRLRERVESLLGEAGDG